jgi:hypothetical protein
VEGDETTKAKAMECLRGTESLIKNDGVLRGGEAPSMIGYLRGTKLIKNRKFKRDGVPLLTKIPLPLFKGEGGLRGMGSYKLNG